MSLIFSSIDSDDAGGCSELAGAATEELAAVEDVSAELEAGVDEAEEAMDVGFVTVEAALAAVLYKSRQPLLTVFREKQHTWKWSRRPSECYWHCADRFSVLS